MAKTALRVPFWMDEPREVTLDLVDAIVCSEINRQAAADPGSYYRKRYPAGMMPADARKLDRVLRRADCEAYALRINKCTREEQLREGFICSAVEVQRAIESLTGNGEVFIPGSRT